MPGGVAIRPSQEADVPAIATIYRHHVLCGTASFEEVPPDAAEISRRRREICGGGLPYLVAERAERIVGFSHASLFRTRSAYRFTVEDSIYIDQAETGRGNWRALLGTLVEVCAKLGYRQMVAVIGGSDQWASIGLHRALGFSWVGLLPAVGTKFGGWVDVVLMQRALGGGATAKPTGNGGDHG
jgi:phosphinothricin acetyltransferase